ncbi:hypothetical protein GSY63_24545 [Mucilaginibacter sp. R11]|uniref:Uncharacterized protein n=1 Tax=Mucilaginibacter agri TaxID=2695265 RepID=A0A965ZN07_9SPHI|nr:hypothetical protein [Mucilaginibacter agri]NCD72557.1 hypothetical protein [Mucilaginibacter agri]
MTERLRVFKAERVGNFTYGQLVIINFSFAISINLSLQAMLLQFQKIPDNGI